MRNLFVKDQQSGEKNVAEMIQRGREIANRSVDQDLSEREFDIIALEGVQNELRAELAEIARQIEELQDLHADKQKQKAVNAVRLKSLHTSVLELKLRLLENDQ